ncbi:phosphatase PAP2 family protein [Flavobacterium sp. FlaQc-52]|uniref:phosphatase PAP2 family protein n=1 Tax=Flavobacterium sp. FlaQc-52 TaxID=3374185 RepID=UPI003757E26B
MQKMMNSSIIYHYTKVKGTFFYLPLFLLISIALYLYTQDSLDAYSYAQIQKNTFFYLNSKLSQYPDLQSNLSETGDTLVAFSFLSLFVLYAPKVWEDLLSASLVGLLFSIVLKKIFAVPRPAAVFNTDNFVIIGKTLCGCNSLPSGHSITVFTTLTVLLLTFMPKKTIHKIVLCSFVLVLGLILVLARVAVGAHYPLDIIVGSIIGYISGLLGIFINQKYNIWSWINNKKYYPVFILMFITICFLMIYKEMHENLMIFSLSLVCLIISICKITTVYAKK